MPRKKAVKKEAKKPAPKKVAYKEYPVVDSNNKIIRIYNTKDHKKDARKLAEGFIKKNRKRGWKIADVPEPEEYPSNYTSTLGEQKV